MTDAGQQGLDLLRVFKAERPELGQLILGREGFVPQISKKRLLVVGAGSVFMMEYAAKKLVDIVVDRGQGRIEGDAIRVTHCQSDTRAGEQFYRNRMGLRIIHDLKAVFEHPQIVVVAAQPVAVRTIQHPSLLQCCQRLIQGSRSQRCVPAPVNQLVTLDDELNFADSATPKFDVAGERLFCELTIDQGFHGADRFKSTKIKVLSVDKRS